MPCIPDRPAVARLLVALFVSLALLHGTVARAGVLASSTFDVGAEGWIANELGGATTP
jgi:hypothetical protein